MPDSVNCRGISRLFRSHTDAAIKKLRKEKYEVSALPDDDKARAEAMSIAKMLAEPIDMRDFRNPMKLREALGLFYEKFAAKGKDRVLIVREDGSKLPADLGGDIYAPLGDRRDLAGLERDLANFIGRLSSDPLPDDP